ncbi:MAG: T9SS type A sorting domain-containing protein [Bacteroidetes bacterium]|nr:T9SS type A sorting domain-containing protein [Bacteroidota bacterium]
MEGKNCFNAPGVTYDRLYSLGNELVLRAGGTFRVTSDTGNTWTSPLRNGFPTGQRPSGLYKANGAWFSSSIAGQIYYSFDLGDNWIQLPTNPEMTITGANPIFTMLNGILYAGGNNVWWNDDTLNIVSGTVYLDNNNNSLLDTGEPVLADHLLYTSPNNIAFDTDSNGNYQFFSAAAGDTLRAILPSTYCQSNPDWFITTGQAASADFGLYFFPGIQDLSIDITNRSVFRPGFDTYLDIDVKNFRTVLTPTILEVILDTSLVFQSASVTPDSINGDTLVFNIAPILLMEKQEISILTETYFTTPLDTPIYCKATLKPIIGDTVPQNNISEINEITTGSFDPNDKKASYDPYFTPTQLMNGEEMIYTIRFQNTGSLPAINIFIRDTLSDFIDLQSFRLISMSHEGYFEFTQNRTVTFYFDNINLPGESVDEPNSHGYVKYAVKYFPSLLYGTGIENTANIYFDFNPPITTNTVVTVIANPPFNVGFPEPNTSSQVTIFPNPVSDLLNLRITNGPINARYRLTVFTSTGKQIIQKYFTSAEYQLEVSAYSNGIYTGILEEENTKHRMIFKVGIAK